MINPQIINVLEFYVLANKLKTTIIDAVHNYSVANHIFGSMILAVAMDSEFNETTNLGKVLRMLVLNEFSRLNPVYNFNVKLNKGNQFTSDSKEVYDFNSKEAKLVLKYKSLDFALTALIEEKESILSYNELLKEAIKLFTPYENYQDYDKYEKVFNFYYQNHKLKNKVRSGWNNKHWNIKHPRIERISEHIVGTIVLALAINSEFDHNLNIDDILKVLVIHEVGETIIGDKTPFDGITKKQKLEIEKQAVIEVIGNLTKKEELLKSIFEFMEENTNEAIFAYYIDKIEADLQSKYYQDSGLHHPLNNQKNNCVFKNPKAQKMLEDGAETAFDIWYEYDKNIYQSSNLYPEFLSILDVVRDNNIFRINNGILKKRINLDKNTYNFLVDKISKLLKSMLDDDNIDSVIMETRSSELENKYGEPQIVVLLKDNANFSEYCKLIRECNNDIFRTNTTNIDVSFYSDYLCMYSAYPTNLTGIIRAERLTLASILFDKSGKITKIKEILEQDSKKEYILPHHVYNYKPPIDIPIALKLKK